MIMVRFFIFRVQHITNTSLAILCSSYMQSYNSAGVQTVEMHHVISYDLD